jgi:pSer/pThr/pTyr-binding forkhead associated (FHA) protein
MQQPAPHYVVTLEFKGRELGRWRVDAHGLRIGRTADNHITIDNLAVSRLHAVIELVDGVPTVRDCDSLNGLDVNGTRSERASLVHGDVITIGKHQIVCRIAGPDGNDAADPDLFEATIMAKPTDQPGPILNPGVLMESSHDRERRHVLDRGLVIIGSDEAADIVIRGRNIATYHVEIRAVDGGYTLRHLDGRARVKIDGRPVKDARLEDGAAISIGDFSFVFNAPATVPGPRG